MMITRIKTIQAGEKKKNKDDVYSKVNLKLQSNP